MPDILSAAAGRVTTGFSCPYVAKYTAGTGGAVTYSNGMRLARGVSVEINPETSDANKFYADNVEAEQAAGTFTGGTATVTVDGLLREAERFIMGLPSPNSSGLVFYGDDQDIPYVGFGYVHRYRSGNVTSYVPEGLCKIMFDQIETSAETQEEEIDWQTQELSASIFRGDDAKHQWKFVGEECETEAEAEEVIRGLFNIV